MILLLIKTDEQKERIKRILYRELNAKEVKILDFRDLNFSTRNFNI